MKHPSHTTGHQLAPQSRRRAWNAVPSVESVPSPHLTPVRELFADADEDDNAAPARSAEPPPPGHSAPSRPPEAPAAADASAAIVASPCAASSAAAALDLDATIHPPPAPAPPPPPLHVARLCVAFPCAGRHQAAFSPDSAHVALAAGTTRLTVHMRI